MNIFEECYEMVRKIPGDFIEFGVHRGNSLIHSAIEARKQNKLIYGIDSFRGLAEPTEHDYENDSCSYPKGKFGEGCSAKLVIERLKTTGLTNEDYKLIEGFVPYILKEIPDIKFSFAYVDLDHYEPTKSTLKWLLNRMSIGGIILCDDYFPERGILAGKAIDEFIATYRHRIKVGDHIGRQVWLQYKVNI